MEATPAPLIHFDKVSKRYGDKLAVNQLSLSIMPGELFAFLGPNGAGKTTSIKMIAGLLRPTQGKVTVAGHDMSSNSVEARRRISYVPDQPYLYEKLTGLDLLKFIRDVYGLTGSHVLDRERELIDTFAIQDFVGDLIETYSHGMRQRLAFAAAMLHDPEVLVVDEPMVGLDPKSMRIVKNLLKQTARSGKAVFMSTHTLGIAEEVADRIGIIKKGHLIRSGTLAQLRQEFGSEKNLEDFFLEVTAEADDARI